MKTERGHPRPLSALLALGGFVGLAAGALAARRWLSTAAVQGRSMAPALLPGDWLLIERATFARRLPRRGEIVLACDPRDTGRELIKRVARVERGMLELRGDNVAGSTDSAAFGTVAASAVEWRVVARYWPPFRIGPVRTHPPVIVEPLDGEPARTFPEALIARS